MQSTRSAESEPTSTPEAGIPERGRSRPQVPQRLTQGAIAVVILALVGAGSYVAYQRIVLPQTQASQPTITRPVQRRDLTITIAANGTIKPERAINISPKNSGILRSLLVKEGDTVEQGQILAYMDDSNLQGRLTQAQAQIATAAASLQELLAGNRSQDIAQGQARLASAQASLKQAQDVYQRNLALAQAGAISQQSLVQYQTAQTTAQAQVREQQQALELLRQGARPEAIAQARAQVEAARGNLQTVESDLADTAIRAPFSGIVTRKFADPGAFVTPTTASSSELSATSSSILALAANNQVVAEVAENNISKIRLGQAVTFTADAYPNQTFQGKVAQIASQATVSQNVTSFEVKLAIADPKNQLKAGMNVAVEFNVGQVKNALVVPNAAIVRQQNGTGVFVVGPEQQPVFKPITTGVTVGRFTEVKSGLTGNEQVQLSLPNLPPGQSGSTRSIFPFPGGGRSGGQGNGSGGQSGGSSGGQFGGSNPGSGNRGGGPMPPPGG